MYVANDYLLVNFHHCSMLTPPTHRTLVSKRPFQYNIAKIFNKLANLINNQIHLEHNIFSVHFANVSSNFCYRMPRVAILSQYPGHGSIPSPRSPACSPSSSPAAGISSRSVSPSSPRSPIASSRHSAFSLVCPRDFHINKEYMTARGSEILINHKKK